MISHHNHESPHDSPTILAERLAATANNEFYTLYASEQGPLTIDQIDPEVVDSPEFKEVVAKHRWPTETDASIEVVHDYHNSLLFFMALAYGGTEGHPQLNNFPQWLRSLPVNGADNGNIVQQIYGQSPVLHRALVVAPDLFEAAREFGFGYNNAAGRSDFMMEVAENEEAIEQLWKAFKILGRLIKVDDTNPSATGKPVESAQEYLTT